MRCELDLQRGQITFDALEFESGEVWRGRLWQPDRERFRRWLRQDLAKRAHGRTVSLGVEGCTGDATSWRRSPPQGWRRTWPSRRHSSGPRAQASRQPDRSDSRLLRELLHSGDLPESWIPPPAVLEWRERVRLYKSLVDQRTVWTQRIHAELHQHGVAVPDGAIRSDATRAWLSAGDGVQLSVAARQRISWVIG